MGEIIKVLMITSSGSEGITLKNTRFVHIIEPYWHPVRTTRLLDALDVFVVIKIYPKNIKP